MTFDYNEFAQNKALELEKQLPQEFETAEKEYITKTTLNFTSMSAEALCNDERLDFSDEQVAFAADCVGNVTFAKACELTAAGNFSTEQKDSVLQKTAFVVFEVAKRGIIKGIERTDILSEIEQELASGYDEALNSVINLDYYKQQTDFDVYHEQDRQYFLQKLEELNNSINNNPDNLGYYEQRFYTCASLASYVDDNERRRLKKIQILDLTKLIDSTQDEERRRQFLQFRSEAYGAIDEYESAIEDLTEILKKSPSDCEILMPRASYFQNIEKYDDAIADYTMALNSNNTVYYGTCLHAIGICYYKKQEWENALEIFEDIIEQKSDLNLDSVFYAAKCCEKLGDLNRAINIINTALNTLRQYYGHKLNAMCGVYYFKNKQYKEFEQEFDNILAVEPEASLIELLTAFDENIEPCICEIIDFLKQENKNSKLLAFFLTGRAILNYENKNFEQTIKDCDEAAQYNPAIETAYSVKVTALLQTGQFDEAKALSDERTGYVLNNANNVSEKYTLECFCARIDCLYRLGLFDEAVLLFSKMQNYNAASAYSYNVIYKYEEIDNDFVKRLKAIEDEANKPDSRLNRLNANIEDNPQNPKAYADRAEFYASFDGGDNYMLAIEDYTKAIELNPDNTQYYIERSSLYSLTDKHKKALEDINKAFELEPDDMDYYQTRASIHSAIKEPEHYQKAIEDYKKFLEKPDKDDNDIQCTNWTIAELYFKLQDYETAIKYLLEVENFQYKSTIIPLLPADSANIQLLLAKCFHRLEQYEKAFEYYARALENGEGCYDDETGKWYDELIIEVLNELIQNNALTEDLKVKIEEFIKNNGV